MKTVGQIVERNNDTVSDSSVDSSDKEPIRHQDTTEEGPELAAIVEDEDNKSSQPNKDATFADSNTGKKTYSNQYAPETSANQHTDTSTRQHPKELVSQGIAFLSGLAETLQSPEATAQLVDSITEKDESTGQTVIKIPVADKSTVSNLLSLVGKLFGNK